MPPSISPSGIDLSPSLRFAFNGQEKTDEISGVGNHIDFKFRGYDSRTGRFWSVDPLVKEYPYYSPYHFAGNTPIQARDIEGKEPDYVNKGSNIIVPGSDYLNNGNPQYKPKIVLSKPTGPTLPMFSIGEGYGVRAFGVTLEGYDGQGGLMGAGSNDGSLSGGVTKRDAYAGAEFVGNSLKVVGTALTLVGQPEAGIPVYEVGDKISNVSEGARIVEDVLNSNTNSAIMRITSVGAGQVGSKLVKQLPIIEEKTKQLLKTAADIKINSESSKAIEKTK